MVLTAAGERAGPDAVVPADAALAAGQHVSGAAAVDGLLAGVEQDLRGQEAAVSRLARLPALLACVLCYLHKYLN